MQMAAIPDRRVWVGLVPFQVTDLHQAADRILRAAAGREGLPIRLSNAYCVALASTDDRYAQLLRESGLNFPDGLPVVWAMRVSGKSIDRTNRVRGPSLFRLTIDKGQAANVRHYFLGTNSNTLDLLCQSLSERYPNLSIAGRYAPPYSDLDEEFIAQCVEQIGNSDPDVIWVALGTPKQDFLAAELAARLGRPCVGVGAAFDFEAGITKEAPELMQRTGTEWIFRFATEPKRLWRRYIFGNVRFLLSVVASNHRRDVRAEESDQI